jgi:CHAD domain-containing protein
MRAAFRVFRDYYDKSVIAPYLKGLKRTGRTLGDVRDLDVFRAKMQTYLDTLPQAQRQSLDNLAAALDVQRQTSRGRLVTYLDSEKYDSFVGQFEQFVETPGMGSLEFTPKKRGPTPHRVRHVAPMAIYRRLAAVRAYDEWVTIPDPPLTRLHALRIACKRLRYTLEFFEEVLGPDTKTLIKEIVAIQDHLGALQDAVVASGILRDFLTYGTWGHSPADELLPDQESPIVAPGVAEYLAAKQLELQHLLDTFPEAWQRFNSDQPSRMVAEAVMVL